MCLHRTIILIGVAHYVHGKGEKDFKNKDAKGRIAHGVGGHWLTGRGPRAARDVGHEGGHRSALRKCRLDDRVGGWQTLGIEV